MAEQQPNAYTVAGRGVHVSYLATSISGQPQLTYQDGHRSLTFSGEELRVVSDEEGQLASISTKKSVDTGYTSFTLLLPRVNLVNGQAAHITTIGIVGTHRTTIDMPVAGQLDTYRVVHLTGNAYFIES
jgi:hypothetical protein